MTSNTSVTNMIESTLTSLTISFEGNGVKFWIFIILQLISITCFLYIFFQFIHTRQLRQSQHHHVILLLLIISFLFIIIALPMTEAYMYLSYTYPSNEFYCSLWNWIHYSLNIINLFLMGFTSIERHWLVFHSWLVREKRRKILFHYCPLAFCILYPPIFYFSAILIWRCTLTYDYQLLLCGWSCYFDNKQWSNIDLYFNDYLPLIVIPSFCLMVYIRMLFQKRTMKQQVFKWRRDKKMILQLRAISSLYLAMWMPLQLAGLINLYWDPHFLVITSTN